MFPVVAPHTQRFEVGHIEPSMWCTFEFYDVVYVGMSACIATGLHHIEHSGS